jgi:uncharacterized membrane protein YgdD (TMEM256/DUF423 family)
MQKFFLSSGAVLGALAVMLGAFGAHALKDKLSVEQLQVFETGVKYQFYHALALCILGVLTERHSSAALNWSGYSFIFGTLFFSGSLYLLASKNLLAIEGWKWLGPVTPMGGLAFIAGWALLLISCLRK